MLRTRKTIAVNPKLDDKDIRQEYKPRDYRKGSFVYFFSKFIVAAVLALGLVFVISSAKKSSQSFVRKNEDQSPTEHMSLNNRSIQEKLHLAPLLDKDGMLYHLVFSTDCSAYQHWQSYLLFYSAFRIQQTGYVTRIVSGCDDEEAERETVWHNKHIKSIFSDRFRIHMTPHFSSVSKNGQKVGDYEYFNKPFGLRHWMEHDDLIDINRQEQDTFVILIDPDMILMRPITYDFSDDTETIVGKRASVDRKFKVSKGQPFAQTYGFGAHWMEKLDLEKIAGPDTPMKSLTKSVASVKYPVGPPYLALVRDMYDIAVKWTEFAPKVHEQYPHLLAEMFAYCAASAHLQLPHQIIDSLMISNTDSTGEGWDLIDKIPDEKICFVAENPTSFALYPVPNVVHYCQVYSFGGVNFSKRRMAEDFFSCHSQLLEKPNVTTTKDQKMMGETSLTVLKREGFMICSIVGTLNEAGTFFKDHHCDIKAP